MGSRRVGSVVVARGLSSCGARALECRLSSCGTWAYLLRGMWDLPGPGLKPVSPALAGGFLTTAPPGKSLDHILFIHHLLMDTWVASTSWLLCVMLLWTCVSKYFFKTLPSILWGLYSVVELLDHMVSLFLIFCGTAKLFSKANAPFYTPTNSAQGFQLFHILTNACYCYLIF